MYHTCSGLNINQWTSGKNRWSWERPADKEQMDQWWNETTYELDEIFIAMSVQAMLLDESIKIVTNGKRDVEGLAKAKGEVRTINSRYFGKCYHIRMTVPITSKADFMSLVFKVMRVMLLNSQSTSSCKMMD